VQVVGADVENRQDVIETRRVGGGGAGGVIRDLKDEQGK